MSKTMEEKIGLAKVILSALNRDNFCRTDLMKLTLRRDGSPSKFNSTLDFLVRNGYVKKLGAPRKRLPYSITELGRKQLELWETQFKKQVS